ncbi:MAG: hypothetical protein U1C96_08020 [Gallionella sp.]|nr:hypothetical protein [Gallionella sp.]
MAKIKHKAGAEMKAIWIKRRLNAIGDGKKVGRSQKNQIMSKTKAAIAN